MSSISPLYLLTLISLTSLFAIDAKATRNQHPSQAKRLHENNLGLSPFLDANIVKCDPLANASKIVEKDLRFPVSISHYETENSDVANVRDLGHYVGYYKLKNTKGSRIFYYFFESIKNPTKAPVVVWLSGGQGCSSSLALFYENGPFKLTKNLSLVRNKFSWNEVRVERYIYRPANRSRLQLYYNHEADIRHTSEEAGVDFYNFLLAFFEKHPMYVNNKFYITGQSYAGHYIPAFVAQIIKRNKENRRTHINLQGMAIGNGWTNPEVQYKSYPEYAKNMHLITHTQYDSLNESVSACLRDLKDCADGKRNDFLGRCIFAQNECDIILERIIGFYTDLNYYDIRKNCTGFVCYDFSAVGRFLNKPLVKKALGVPEGIPFVLCSRKVQDAMSGDRMRNFAVYIPELLNDGIKLLIYAGQYDLVYNWLGNFEWVKDMKWNGHQGFLSATNATFRVCDSKAAGWYKAYGPLTFLMVKDAGQMVPMDQPKASLEMLRKWINDIPL